MSGWRSSKHWSILIFPAREHRTKSNLPEGIPTPDYEKKSCIEPSKPSSAPWSIVLYPSYYLVGFQSYSIDYYACFWSYWACLYGVIIHAPADAFLGDYL